MIFSGGEPCSAELATRWAASPVAMWHGYGPTETTVAVTAARSDRPRATRMPLGQPIGAASVYVVDCDLGPVPTGATGELYVGGPGVGRGYLDDPAATAAVFVPNPFDSVPGSRIYRTGDLVTLGAGDELAYIGRRDRQLKVRGVRIEPAELEDALHRHPAVRQSVVEMITTDDGRDRLVAFVSVERGHSGVDLRAYLADVFPSTMLPDRVVVLDVLPRTVNDKVDRRALARLLVEDTVPTMPVPNGLTELEARVAEILFAPAIGHVPDGLDDDFFGLGGNSLEAIKLLAGVPEEFGVEISVADFIAEPTVRGTADAIATATADLFGDR